MAGKQEIRERIWNRMKQRSVTLFPGPEGRIPNFKGREDALEQLTQQPAYEHAEAIKINPDSPQTPVRERAFSDGKVLYMAVPKLQSERCFLELDPVKIEAEPSDISSIKGANTHGKPVHPDDMPGIDLIVTGAVGVDQKGHRLGKGGGYSDLEFALLLHYELIDPDLPIWTTVHPTQIVEDPLPAEPNDISLNGIATPEETIRVESPPERPRGIEWDRLSEERIKSIPILQSLRN